MSRTPIITSPTPSPSERSSIRPVVFDILGPDRETSLLPSDLKMVLHTNPQTFRPSYQKLTDRQQTLAGFVEAHWGDAPTELTFEATTGGFVRLYTGMSGITGVGPSNDKLPVGSRGISLGGTRRDTIAYDKYLDMLALFKNNGSIYDINGNIALQGQIQVAFDGHYWWGWFASFSVSESADKPYQFALSASFTIEREKHFLR